MKYKTIIETDDFKNFKFFEDGNGKYIVGIDAGAKDSEWIALYFTEYKQELSRDMEEIEDVINCDADAETKCKMISNILTANHHYFEKPAPKTWHCRDCKWWKDSDGAYRRGAGAESQCPINREEVYEGNGYCFLFEPKEKEDE